MRNMSSLASDTNGDAAIGMRIIGIQLVALGVVLMAIFWSGFSLLGAYSVAGWMIGIGLLFVALSFKGTAMHRVTWFTRYPQQTGSLDDAFLQIYGDRYLWFRIAVGLI